MTKFSEFPYVADRFNAVRRETVQVRVGDALIGGNAPILVQSMTTTKPKDVEKTVAETLALAKVGCGLVRITAPTFADAQGLEEVMKQVRAAGCKVPVSADIHFQPKAAFEALKWVEKVRINPGNFVDTGILTLDQQTDKSFEEGKEKVAEAFTPFVQEAKRLGRAIRIGVNHGSLAARMIYRYGDTVEGMVESAMEYLAVCEAEHFDQVVLSLKSSNPRVAIAAYRMLAARIKQEGFKPYPFHVGVTEAGAGADGRLKSAAGIGALLLDGLADTIRVSLTEDPVAEVPVAQELIKACALPTKPVSYAVPVLEKDPYHYERRETTPVTIAGVEIGGNHPVKVGVKADAIALTGERRNAEFALPSLSEKPIVEFKDAMDIVVPCSATREPRWFLACAPLLQLSKLQVAKTRFSCTPRLTTTNVKRSAYPPISEASSPTVLATPSSSTATRAQKKAFFSPSIFCRPPTAAAARPTLSAARAAAAPSTTFSR